MIDDDEAKVGELLALREMHILAHESEVAAWEAYAEVHRGLALAGAQMLEGAARAIPREVLRDALEHFYFQVMREVTQPPRYGRVVRMPKANAGETP